LAGWLVSPALDTAALTIVQKVVVLLIGIKSICVGDFIFIRVARGFYPIHYTVGALFAVTLTAQCEVTKAKRDYRSLRFIVAASSKYFIGACNVIRVG
jgi:hypothetical protein